MALKSTAEGAQSLIMPRVGQTIDRWGGVPVLVVSQVLVSLSMLFFLVATPAQWWWIIGAYVLWIAYAGVNTSTPKLMLSLTPRAQYTSYAAAWFAWQEFVYALSTIAGGLLFDWASKNFTPRVWAGLPRRPLRGFLPTGIRFASVGRRLGDADSRAKGGQREPETRLRTLGWSPIVVQPSTKLSQVATGLREVGDTRLELVSVPSVFSVTVLVLSAVSDPRYGIAAIRADSWTKELNAESAEMRGD